MIVTSKMNVNSQVYQETMIKGPLLTFLNKYYPNGNYIFWPILASAHYARSTQQLLGELSIPFVPKNQNPPNAPQSRPIERFWAHLKYRVYEGGWKADNPEQLKSRIIEKLETFSDAYYCNLMSKVKSKVRKADDKGLDFFPVITVT